MKAREIGLKASRWVASECPAAFHTLMFRIGGDLGDVSRREFRRRKTTPGRPSPFIPAASFSPST